MRTQTLAYAVLLFVLALRCPVAQGQESLPSYRKLKLPSGKHFPASQTALLQMRNAADDNAVREMRVHAWDLFAGLTKGETPIWDTWFTECDLGLLACVPPNAKETNSQRLLRNFAVPTQFLEPLSETTSAVSMHSMLDLDPVQTMLLNLAKDLRARPQLASVLFNKETRKRIQKDCLHPSKTALGTISVDGCKPRLSATGTIRDFDSRAIVLKMEWAAVAKTDPRLWIYKPDLWTHVQNPRAWNPDSAQEEVQIKLPSTPPSNEDQCRDGDYTENEAVPLSCFYYVQPKAEDLEALRRSKGLSDILASGVQPGEYLVLVAVHVTTKEIPEWVWATFWWDRRGRSDKRAEGRPTSVGLRWRHFLMDTTLSGAKPGEKEDGGPKICFNPYLETKIFFHRTVPTGIVSNCLQCHSRASYSPKGQAARFDPYDQGILARDGKTLEGSGAKPASDQEYFDGRVKTDFLWSISEALTPQVQKLRGQFRLALQSLEDQEENRLQQLREPPAQPKQ